MFILFSGNTFERLLCFPFNAFLFNRGFRRFPSKVCGNPRSQHSIRLCCHSEIQNNVEKIHDDAMYSIIVHLCDLVLYVYIHIYIKKGTVCVPIPAANHRFSETLMCMYVLHTYIHGRRSIYMWSHAYSKEQDRYMYGHTWCLLSTICCSKMWGANISMMYLKYWSLLGHSNFGFGSLGGSDSGWKLLLPWLTNIGRTALRKLLSAVKYVIWKVSGNTVYNTF